MDYSQYIVYKVLLDDYRAYSTMMVWPFNIRSMTTVTASIMLPILLTTVNVIVTST